MPNNIDTTSARAELLSSFSALRSNIQRMRERIGELSPDERKLVRDYNYHLGILHSESTKALKQVQTITNQT